MLIFNFRPFLGVWVPEDAVVHPKKVSEALAYLAYTGGAKFVGNCELSSVNTHNSNKYAAGSSANITVESVSTSLGKIECEYFVNCGGKKVFAKP